MKAKIGLEDKMTPEQKETWKLYLEARLKLHDTIKSTQDALQDLDNYLPKIIAIFMEEDIPIESVTWTNTFKKVVLKEETKLTKRAYDKLRILLPTDRKPEKYVQDGYVRFTYYPKFITFNDFDVDNGKGTCKVERVVEQRYIPGHTSEDVSYKVADGCSGLELTDTQLGD